MNELNGKTTALEEAPGEPKPRASVADTPGEHPSKVKEATEHPITKAVSRLVFKLRDSDECAVEFVPVAEKKKLESVRKAVGDLPDLMKVFRLKELEEGLQVRLLKFAFEWLPKGKRLAHADPGRVLRDSLFVGIFGAFDAFTGDLLRALFERKPALFHALRRQVDVGMIMESQTLDDLKRSLIEEEIEAFRRESYADQFTKLESLFGLKLREFPRWGEFIERSQRRNVLTHCDGLVTPQYLKACAGAGTPSAEKIGTRLGVPLPYLRETIELLMEVGIKLAQTLWRKVIPEELDLADRSLNQEIYDKLCEENWKMALVLTDFASGLPRVGSDVNQKVFTVNYIIAAKFGGRPEKATEKLASLDWSGASADFQLAKAVLEDRFDDACAVMLRIGKDGEFMREVSYHTFPLFRAFRLQDGFLKTYEKIFGRAFLEPVQETLDETKNQLKAEAKQSAEIVEGRTDSDGSGVAESV
jgi:hypothetical protein